MCLFISVSKCQAYNKPSIKKDRAPSLFRLYRTTQKLTALVVDPEKTDKMPQEEVVNINISPRKQFPLNSLPAPT